MTPAEQVVTIAAKLYDMRRTVRRLAGDDYAERVDPYKPGLAAYARDHGVGLVEAFGELTKVLVDGGHDVSVLYLGAACVDMVEDEDGS